MRLALGAFRCFHFHTHPLAAKKSGVILISHYFSTANFKNTPRGADRPGQPGHESQCVAEMILNLTSENKSLTLKLTLWPCRVRRVGKAAARKVGKSHCCLSFTICRKGQAGRKASKLACFRSQCQVNLLFLSPNSPHIILDARSISSRFPLRRKRAHQLIGSRRRELKIGPLPVQYFSPYTEQRFGAPGTPKRNETTNGGGEAGGSKGSKQASYLVLCCSTNL